MTASGKRKRRILLSMPPTRFQEAVVVRRVSTLDGYAMMWWMAPAPALMVAGEVALGAPGWCYLVNGLQALHLTAELATQHGLTHLGGRPWPLARWLNSISMASWGRLVRVTVPGVLAGAAWIAAVFGVLAAGLPPAGDSGWTLAAWLGGVLYPTLGLRLFTNEATLDTNLRSAPVYAWGHRLAGPFGAAGCLAALAWAHFGRGLGTPESLPGLILVCLLPLVIGQETTLVDRLLHAAEVEHQERLTAAEKRLARLAAETSGRLGALALGELIHLAHDAAEPQFQPRGEFQPSAAGKGSGTCPPLGNEIADAIAALRDAPDLVAILPELTASGSLPTPAAEALLRAALTGWPGQSAAQTSGRELGIWEAERCMRLTRQMVVWLTELDLRTTDQLAVRLAARDDAARLTFELDVRLDAVKLSALAARLAAATRPGGGRVTIPPAARPTLAVEWNGRRGAHPSDIDSAAGTQGPGPGSTEEETASAPDGIGQQLRGDRPGRPPRKPAKPEPQAGDQAGEAGDGRHG
ncbi:MAG: hypothetical protein LBS27_04360 [Bifidobacteriaceae bacterium]|jgi:hypothetical protein|nr:hypothetical protein [Bifidobacteriaceae bacterium]